MRPGDSRYFISARREIEKLRERATPRELSKLSIGNLEPDQNHRCIYGLMTGDCFSARAIDLIVQCASRSVSCQRVGYLDSIVHQPPRTKMKILDSVIRCNFTIAEHLIVNYPHNNPGIIAYLRGESDNFTLTKTPK